MAFMVAALVAACGGGGGGGGGVTGASGATSNTANATKTYLFYQGSDLTLTAVDPVTGVSSPVATGIVAASSVVSPSSIIGSSPSAIRGGTFSAGTISDLHTQALVYSSAGSLWQVSAIAGAAAPAPTQVSNVAFGAAGTSSTAYCYTFTEADFATPGNSAIIIGEAGADLKCNTADDLVSVTTLGASATTTPIQLTAGTRALGAVHNPSTGAISGALLLVPTATAGTSNLLLTGPTLNPVGAVTVLTGVTTASTGVLSTSATGKKLMMISGALWKYDPAVAVSAANPAAVGYNFTTGAAHILSDGINTYFADNLSFYRVPMDGSAAPTLMYIAPAGTQVWNVMLTANYIVYDWSNATNNNNGVSSLPKAAANGTVPTVFLSNTNANTAYFLHSVSGTAVNFSDLLRGYAYHYNEDGTGQVTYGTASVAAIWYGRVEPTTQTLGMSDGSYTARAFLYSTTYTGATRTTDMLDSYDPASGALVANLGSWPAGAIAAVQGSEYIANNGATLYFLKDMVNAPNYANPFLVNVNASNSLTQLTNTPTINESKVGGGGY